MHSSGPMLEHTPPLYDARDEHDACGVGFVASHRGEVSHRIVRLGLEAVRRLTHRGAVAADAKTGDGAGVLTQIPHTLLAEAFAAAGEPRVEASAVGIGVFFLDRRDPRSATRFRHLAEEACQVRGIRVVGWRKVPVDESVLGARARASAPDIHHLLLVMGASVPDGEAYERRLYLARKELENRARRESLGDNYVVSMSSRTIVYKGLVVGAELGHFYPDLVDPRFTSAAVVFHQRYSTNTKPTWELAQPFRMLAHNGEINTIQGNRNWMTARTPELTSTVWGNELPALLPVTDDSGSDTSSLDHVLELLVLSGRSLVHSAMTLVPEAWESMPDMRAELRDFYAYHACLMEPWDGPAALAFCDGRWVGAALDRNGLRPARFLVTDDGTVCMASEAGVLDLDDAHVIEKGRLGPGRLLAIDLERGRLLHDGDAKSEVIAAAPYGRWLRKHRRELPAAMPTGNAEQAAAVHANGSLAALQHAYGFTREDLTHIVDPMTTEVQDPVFSMGNDTPLAALSRFRPTVFGYLKQRFAQVTNPPIDPLRETLVMSLDVLIGPRASLLEEREEAARLLRLPSPVLLDDELSAIEATTDPALRSARVDATFPAAEGPGALEPAIERLCAKALEAVEAGTHVLIVSDRAIGPDRAPIPVLLAVGALHHALIDAGVRMRADLIVDSGQVWDVHHFCALLGYGASAVCPYLAWRTVADSSAADGNGTADPRATFKRTAEAGILKVMSKMGISTLSSYHGAQIFEAVGLSAALVERSLRGTPSRVGGLGFRELTEDVLSWHAAAFDPQPPNRLVDTGSVRYRRNGEFHAANPQIVKALHRALESNAAEDFAAYDQLVNSRDSYALRDLMRFKPGGAPAPLAEVEPVETIVRRFVSTAMSVGALSPEAHSTLSRGMNRLRARSNTGEGGEDPSWYQPDARGDWLDSRIKQVASARFGVTPNYLAHAEELEIKMAQGSKPGEGGQLPAHKVTAYIAGLRHTIAGIPLISPPPHHDIYSIEDLAQLIYDLKQANTRARVGVKLVAESGVGTVAAGVAKAYADYVLISGHDGGTGASPLSSIKNAGVPWEIGLAETQQVLVTRGLRNRIRVRTDGGLKTARDVVIAGLLGAEEFGFGTAAVLSVGCVMARQCHLNTCPVGVATQREDLRQRFAGQPEHVVRFFLHIAQGVRELLAELGFRRFDELVGRVDRLELDPDRRTGRAASIELDRILAPPDPTWRAPLRHMHPRNDRPGDEPLDLRILADAEAALEHGRPVQLAYAVTNADRAVGTRLSGVIAHDISPAGLPEDTIRIALEGSAGQSLGAFGIRGVRLDLSGEANDYVAKGLGGATVSIRPPAEAAFEAASNVIAGNTCLYGATSGQLFVAGRAGERFGVRNSGATAVVEGVGDHACEYMTGGSIVVLGPTGRNFAAGMSAGTAYVYDPDRLFPGRANTELVSIDRVTESTHARRLRGLVEAHAEATGSALARWLLERWQAVAGDFWQVNPRPPQVDTDPAAQVDAERARRAVEARRRAARRPRAAASTPRV